jgi:hypothetical protein
MGRANLDYSQYQQVCINPAWNDAYYSMIEAENAYQNACSNARAGANNWMEVNAANRALNAATAAYNNTEKYITVTPTEG